MHHIDSVNFEKTYRIIKKYGFPEYDLREWKHDSLRAGITTVATHFNYSSNKGKKMQKLIIKEYKKGRIGDVGMRQMLWHIKGRKGNARSEAHTSELQSRPHLVCRLLLEKKKKKRRT